MDFAADLNADDVELEKVCLGIYRKIDTQGIGHIDRGMLKTYCTRVKAFVQPNVPFDEEGFEKGF